MRLALATLIGLASGAACTAAHGEPAGGRGLADDPSATLFVRLGGLDGLRALVDELTARLASDDRLLGFFRDTDFARFKHHLLAFLCALTGGPCRYRGRSMDEAHRGRGIHRGHFDAFVDDVAASLRAIGARARERGELLAALRELEGAVESP